jgi:AraC-like DNA-binding protein
MSPTAQNQPAHAVADEALGLELRRLSGKAASQHIHGRAAIIAPLQDSVIELERGTGRAAGRPERLDRAVIAMVPAASRYRVRAISPVTEVVTLQIGPIAIARVCADYAGHVDAAQFEQLLTTPRLLPRTRWVDELIHRYVFERDVCKKADSRAAIFLEIELAKEMFFLCNEQAGAFTRASVLATGDDLVARARAILDAAIFAPPLIGALAKRCHTSPSSLLRAFSRELGCSPTTYVRERRLDAALLLVQAGQLSMGEIATRVGYSNLPAFTAAFHKRFGKPPSALRGRDDALVTLPPHGMMPRTER